MAVLSASESSGRPRAMTAAIDAPIATTATIAIARDAASHRRLRQRRSPTSTIPTMIMPMVPPTIAGTHATTTPTALSVATIRSCHQTSMVSGS